MFTWMMAVKSLLSFGCIMLVCSGLMRVANPPLQRLLILYSLLSCWAGWLLLLFLWQVWHISPKAHLWLHVVVGNPQNIAILLLAQAILLGWGVVCLTVQAYVIYRYRGHIVTWLYQLVFASWWLAFISTMLVYR